MLGLIITFVVYASFKELNSRQDKCVRYFSFTLGFYHAMAYAFIFRGFDLSIEGFACVLWHYIYTYVFNVNILWLNFLSFDIWRALRWIKFHNCLTTMGINEY